MMAAHDGGSRGRLRTATSDAHGRVDACFPHGLGDLQAYRQYLCGMHGLIAALEAGLAEAALDATWQAWRHPSRLDWLTDDLTRLGATPMPQGPRLQMFDSAEAAGALYVLEGSALGATQLLADALKLGCSATSGARFLHGHGGANAGRRWRDYVQCLERAHFDARAEQAMFDAAARTFAYAEHEFLRAARIEG